MLACLANGKRLCLNSRGFYRFRRRSRSLFLLVLILIAFMIHGSEMSRGMYEEGMIGEIEQSVIRRCNRGGGRVMPGNRMLRDDYRVNGVRKNWKGEKLYIGRSGDPWGESSPSTNHDESIYTRISPANVTSNSTNGAPTGEKSFVRRRLKRGVVHLYNMVVCATGCNPLAYKGYGCYCGFLGSGYVIDGIDRCCKMHDWCYDATECPMFMEYFVPYYWKCYRGYKPICAVEHGNWGASGSCAQRLCECDRSLAECLRRYPCPTTKAVCTSSPWRLVQNLFMVM